MKTAPVLTTTGLMLMNEALNGSTVTFTKFQVGNGIQTAQDIRTVTSLAHPVYEFSNILIDTIDKSETGKVYFEGVFSSSPISEQIEWRELGLFAVEESSSSFSGDGINKKFTVTQKPPKINRVIVSGTSVIVNSYDPATGIVNLAVAPSSGTNNVVVYYPYGEEKLYSYAYDGSTTVDMIVPPTTGVAKQYNLRVSISISDTTYISALVSSESSAYTTNEDFQEHTYGTNPHSVTSEQIGLGNVDNVCTDDYEPNFIETQTNQQLTIGDSISILFGKLAKIVRSLISHFSNTSNPHNVTVQKIETEYGNTFSVVGHTHNESSVSSGVISLAAGGTGGSYYTVEALKQALGGEIVNVSVELQGGYGKDPFTQVLEFYSSSNKDIIFSAGAEIFIDTEGVVCPGNIYMISFDYASRLPKFVVGAAYCLNCSFDEESKEITGVNSCELKRTLFLSQIIFNKSVWNGHGSIGTLQRFPMIYRNNYKPPNRGQLVINYFWDALYDEEQEQFEDLNYLNYPGTIISFSLTLIY